MTTANKRKDKVLLIYTGGTIGMVQDESGALQPFAMERIYDALPLLHRTDYLIDSCQLDRIIDSSNMTPEFWVSIANIIEAQYDNYDGFVVLHGTDTMAYTASALSFMFKNLSKPIVLTGSQLPLGMLRSDGRENIICALEIASGRQVQIPEVTIFFESHLYRGNRSTKVSAENFDAFSSFNYPSLAKAGIKISYKDHLFLPMPEGELRVRKGFDRRIAVLKLFPGITPAVVQSVVRTPDLQGLVIETFGSGNAPTEKWFIDALQEALDRGVIVLNVTQCKAGAVQMRQYQASCDMDRIGVIGGHDITIEAAVTKMMYLLGNFPEDKDKIRDRLGKSLRGEISLETSADCDDF
ncbi:MAG: type I asparaginase [Bacteroidales bacterium]|nr:type I asparaginase [Bacteroidales bacterium]MCR4931679.1 type I asparaginase [Bacteroidales bacterium]